MSGLGPHAAYIMAAYGLTTLVLGALITWVVTERRRQDRRLARLEQQGLKRRGKEADGA
jgi:heme exporter protein D